MSTTASVTAYFFLKKRMRRQHCRRAKRQERARFTRFWRCRRTSPCRSRRSRLLVRMKRGFRVRCGQEGCRWRRLLCHLRLRLWGKHICRGLRPWGCCEQRWLGLRLGLARWRIVRRRSCDTRHWRSWSTTRLRGLRYGGKRHCRPPDRVVVRSEDALCGEFAQCQERAAYFQNFVQAGILRVEL